jgi:predicted Ser/Thr protein kinase
MGKGRAEERHPAYLAVGTRVGEWKVEGWLGRGSYGAVYRAVQVGREKEGPVALKVAVHPEDPRFEREAGLLSRLDHTSVPQLYARGEWRQGEKAFPYLVMEWVEGQRLYDWAAARNPTSRQLLRVLAQVARALEAIHAQGAVHRDVKGDNVVVAGEGEACLMDLGACTWKGASTLTREVLPPGTTAYWSPEAWRYAEETRRQKGAHYEAQPSDDVFALGVTGYRLVTEEYPPTTDPSQEASGVWRGEGPGLRAPLQLNPRLNAWLSMQLLRMLSVRPEARGSAGEAAEALEQEAEQADGEADLPVFAWETQRSAAWSQEEKVAALELGYRPRYRVREKVYEAEAKEQAARDRGAWPEERHEGREGSATGSARPQSSQSRLWVVPVLVGAVCLVLGRVSGKGEEEPEPEEERPMVAGAEASDGGVPDGGVPDGGAAELAEAALTARVEKAEILREWASLRMDMPKKPLPGQSRPDADGKCQRSGHRAINGACWLKAESVGPPCEEGWYEWKGSCYFPIPESREKPPSDPP